MQKGPKAKTAMPVLDNASHNVFVSCSIFWFSILFFSPSPTSKSMLTRLLVKNLRLLACAQMGSGPATTLWLSGGFLEDSSPLLLTSSSLGSSGLAARQHCSSWTPYTTLFLFVLTTLFSLTLNVPPPPSKPLSSLLAFSPI